MLDNGSYLRNPVRKPLKSRKSCEEIIASAKMGRAKALLSISRYCVRLSDRKRNIHEIWTNHPPSLGELVDSLGAEYQLIAISRERKPVREDVKAIPYFGPT